MGTGQASQTNKRQAASGQSETTNTDTATKPDDPEPKPETESESNKQSVQTSELELAPDQTPTETGLTTQSEPAPANLTAQANPTFNLTDLQWGLSGIPLLTPSASDASKAYCVNIPGRKEGRNNENAPANSSGTICIVDTGMDVTHPDLADVLYTFTDAQQQKFGCGPHGVNAVYASGNRVPSRQDMDVNADLGAENRSPYAITVNAAHITDKQSAASVPDEYRGLLTVAGAGVHEVSWIDISFDIPNFVAAAKYVHRLTPEQREAINPLMTVDPGDVQEPYVWNHDGTNYLLVRLAVPRTAS